MPRARARPASTAPARLRKRRRTSRKPGEPRPAPPPPPKPPGPPQAAGGHTLAQQIPARAAYAEAYKPPDALPRRQLVPIGDPFEPLGIRAGTFLLKPSIDVTRGYDTNPARTSTGQPSRLHRGRAGAEGPLAMVGHEAGADIRGTYSWFDSQPSLNRPMLRRQGFRALRRLARHRLQRRRPLLPFDRLSGQPERAGRCRQAADLPHLRHDTRPDAALQPFRDLPPRPASTAPNTRTPISPTAPPRATTTATSTSMAAALRGSYEVFPGVKPFVEIAADTRKHDLQFDRNGFERNSQRAHAQGRHQFRDIEEAHRRGFGRLSHAQVQRSQPCRNCAAWCSTPRWSMPRPGSPP